jgi:hypothetical protein
MEMINEFHSPAILPQVPSGYEVPGSVWVLWTRGTSRPQPGTELRYLGYSTRSLITILTEVFRLGFALCGYQSLYIVAGSFVCKSPGFTYHRSLQSSACILVQWVSQHLYSSGSILPEGKKVTKHQLLSRYKQREWALCIAIQTLLVLWRFALRNFAHTNFYNEARTALGLACHPKSLPNKNEQVRTKMERSERNFDEAFRLTLCVHLKILVFI